MRHERRLVGARGTRARALRAGRRGVGRAGRAGGGHGIALASGCCAGGYAANGTYTAMGSTGDAETGLPYPQSALVRAAVGSGGGRAGVALQSAARAPQSRGRGRDGFHGHASHHVRDRRRRRRRLPRRLLGQQRQQHERRRGRRVREHRGEHRVGDIRRPHEREQHQQRVGVREQQQRGDGRHALHDGGAPAAARRSSAWAGRCSRRRRCSPSPTRATPALDRHRGLPPGAHHDDATGARRPPSTASARSRCCPTIVLTGDGAGEPQRRDAAADLANNTHGASPAWGAADPSTIYLFVMPPGTIATDSTAACCTTTTATTTRRTVGRPA